MRSKNEYGKEHAVGRLDAADLHRGNRPGMEPYNGYPWESGIGVVALPGIGNLRSLLARREAVTKDDGKEKSLMK
ncbi:MAG: hypothetical protein K6C37_06680 [Bacteroidales bacterium]|nr:hypothetical protein [Bacteroidales bacterium]